MRGRILCGGEPGAMTFVVAALLAACGGNADANAHASGGAHAGGGQPAALGGASGKAGANDAAGGADARGGASDVAGGADTRGGANASNAGAPGAGDTSFGGMTSFGGSNASGGRPAGGGDASTGGVYTLPTGYLGKPCSGAVDCGHSFACDLVQGTCRTPCMAGAASSGNTVVVACKPGEVCALDVKGLPWTCTPTCTSQTCPNGLICEGGRCARPSYSTAGMPCRILPPGVVGSYFLYAACATPELACADDICKPRCDASLAEPGCPSGEQCLYDSACVARGNPAAIGEVCTLGGLLCGGDGKVWRGRCSGTDCRQFCGDGSACPPAETCEDGICVRHCDESAAEPGCDPPQVCNHGYCINQGV